MNYNPYAFISDDIIQWNGIICKFGAVEHFINEGDDLRVANEDEVKNYNLKSI